MPKDPFDSAQIAVPCPKCGQKTERAVGRLRRETHLDCPACGETFAVDATDLDQGLGRAAQAIQKFRKAIKRIK